MGEIVYIHGDESPSSFCSCGALVEGPFIVTCRHVWQKASAAAATRGSTVKIRFLPSGGDGEETFRTAHLASACDAARNAPDLVILGADGGPPGSSASRCFVVTRDASVQHGAGTVIAGLRGRDPIDPDRVIDVTVSGTIRNYVNSFGLRQFTGTTPDTYWPDRGSSGSPVCLEGSDELAGLLRLSETAKRPGEAPIHEAFVIPAATVHRHLRLHVGCQMAQARGLDLNLDRIDDILREPGAATLGIEEVRQRLQFFFESVAAATLSKAEPSADSTVLQAERLFGDYEPAAAMKVLDDEIAARAHALVRLLEEKARQQRLLFDHDGAANTLQQITSLRPGWPWSWFELGDVHCIRADRKAALHAYCQGADAAVRSEDERGLSAGHDRIGGVLLPEGDRNGALAAFRAGLAIREVLAARDPGNAEWQRDLSISHNNIGGVLLQEGNRDSALAAFRAGLAIAEVLAARDPGNVEWQRDLILSCLNMAEVDQGQERGWLERGKAIVEALIRAERLAPQDEGLRRHIERLISELTSE